MTRFVALLLILLAVVAMAGGIDAVIREVFR